MSSIRFSVPSAIRTSVPATNELTAQVSARSRMPFWPAASNLGARRLITALAMRPPTAATTLPATPPARPSTAPIAAPLATQPPMLSPLLQSSAPPTAPDAAPASTAQPTEPMPSDRASQPAKTATPTPTVLTILHTSLPLQKFHPPLTHCVFALPIASYQAQLAGLGFGFPTGGGGAT